MEPLLIELIGHFGLPGLFLAWLIWQIRRLDLRLEAKDAECKAERDAKDKAIAAESAARVSDAKEMTKLALEITGRVHATVDKIVEREQR